MEKIQSSILFVLLLLVQTLVFLPTSALGFTTSSNATLTADTTIGTTYSIVDTGQTTCYDNMYAIEYPQLNESFGGQDANYIGNQTHYVDNGDGTVTDLVTSLMWQQTPSEKKTYTEIIAGVDDFELAGYDDWRLPTIKELYSLILFTGEDPSGYEGTDTSGLTPIIDTNYFDFEYGDTSAGERIIDSQYASATTYVSDQALEGQLVFGVNFADGRIKGYGTGPMPGSSTDKPFSFIHVRNNTNYGINDFVDNEDGTITDVATSLMWSQNDSCVGLNWEEALDWVQEMNNVNYLGYSDWRLPNVKELQSIVDYTRCPDTTDSASIDPLFNCSTIINEEDVEDYPFYWTSTTHATASGTGGFGCYVAFGRSLGYLDGEWQDVHGAGSQRSDPKEGNPDNYPTGHGPQGDAIRIYNYIRLVRGGVADRAESIEDYPVYSNTQESGTSILYIGFFIFSFTAIIIVLRKRK